MKAIANNVIVTAGSFLASIALIFAMGGAGRGCWFMYHQPKLPEELK